MSLNLNIVVPPRLSLKVSGGASPIQTPRFAPKILNRYRYISSKDKIISNTNIVNDIINPKKGEKNDLIKYLSFSVDKQF